MASSSRTRTVTLPRVTNQPRPATATPGAPLFEDQIREYRQDQRRNYVLQRRARNALRRIRGRPSTTNTLEQQISPEVQLQLSMAERANIAPAEVLYRTRRDDAHHRVYVHRSEESVLCVGDTQIERLAQRLSEDSGSSSEWRPLVIRNAGFLSSPTVRLNIRTVTDGSVTKWVTEIHGKEFSTSPQKLVFSGLDIAELEALFTPGTYVDAYFSLEPYDYKQNAGIRLVAKKLIIHSN